MHTFWGQWLTKFICSWKLRRTFWKEIGKGNKIGSWKSHPTLPLGKIITQRKNISQGNWDSSTKWAYLGELFTTSTAHQAFSMIFNPLLFLILLFFIYLFSSQIYQLANTYEGSFVTLKLLFLYLYFTFMSFRLW